jgi:hypothetical protein
MHPGSFPLLQDFRLPVYSPNEVAGLAVNAAVHDKPAKEKLEFFGNSFLSQSFLS